MGSQLSREADREKKTEERRTKKKESNKQIQGEEGVRGEERGIERK